MRSILINLAVEDDLSEWVLRRVLRDHPDEFTIGSVFKKNGFGYLKRMAPAFNNMAKCAPVLMLTDLDDRPCPPELLNEWLKRPRHPNFILRVAVREVEAWLLGCDQELRKFLGLRKAVNFPNPETVEDPKLELLRLADSSSRRKIREAIVRRDTGGNLRQGPAYNSTLSEFVNESWIPVSARAKCPSLERLFAALSALEK